MDSKANLYERMQAEEAAYHGTSFDLGGTIRRKQPQDTLRALLPLLKDFGITRVADIGGLDQVAIPVAAAIRPNAKHLCGALGKGISRNLAHISAIMEAVESHYMENPPQPVLTGRYSQLINTYPVFDPLQFPKGRINHRRLQDLDLAWINCFNLTQKTDHYIPHPLVNMNSSEPYPFAGLFAVSSNGLASGNTLNEAISHGLYEVIERESVGRWLHKPKAERDQDKVDLNVINSEENRYLIERFNEAGVKLEVWNVTSALRVPTFYALIYDIDNFDAQGVFYGSGSHLSAEIAFSRAVTEALQSRVAFTSGSRDDIYPRLYDKQRRTQKKLMTDMLGDEHQPISNAKAKPTLTLSASLLSNIETLVSHLKNEGYSDVLVFEHSPTESEISVVQVFVPGFQYHKT